MNSRIRIRDTVALLIAVVVAAIALGQGISADLHVPAARILVAECQGFEALATVGGTPLTCNTAQGEPAGDALSPAASTLPASFVTPVVASILGSVSLPVVVAARAA